MAINPLTTCRCVITIGKNVILLSSKQHKTQGPKRIKAGPFKVKSDQRFAASTPHFKAHRSELNEVRETNVNVLDTIRVRRPFKVKRNPDIWTSSDEYR